MRRCLKGRIVACIRSNEMTAMFVREVRGNQMKRKSIITFRSWLKFIFTMSHEPCEKSRNKRKWENPPTNISAMVRLITRYMARVRRLRFFIKTMIDRRFTVTMATHTVRVTANQVMHSDEWHDLFSFTPFRFTLLPVLFCSSSTFRKNLNWIKFDYLEKKSRRWDKQ